MQTGIGTAARAFDPGRILMLGGVKVPGVWGLRGPGDGDVLLVAIADAALGAAGLGDVRDHIREDEADAPSAALLADCVVKLAARGLTIRHVDASMGTDRAEVRAERLSMKTRIASLLGIDAAAVNVKTSDASEKGVAALAVVTVGESA